MPNAESMIVKLPGFAWPQVPTLHGETIIELTKRLMAQNVAYGLGAKASPIGVDSHQFVGTLNGQHVREVDCSGFSRYILNKAADGFLIPDGSQIQWSWVKAHGFKESTIGDAGNADGNVRIAFLPVVPGVRKIGHVVLLPGDGSTCESHGGKGVDRRKWDPGTYHWMADCHVYVLALAKG